jgi:hypothetical protein
VSDLPSAFGGLAVQGGAVGLLGVVALMVFTGRLIPRTIYREMERDRDHWREVALKAIGQSDALLPAAHIAVGVTRSLSDATSPTAAQPRAGRPESVPS